MSVKISPFQQLKAELAEMQYMHDRLHDFETAEYVEYSEKLKAKNTLIQEQQAEIAVLKESVEKLSAENKMLTTQLKLATERPSDNGY